MIQQNNQDTWYEGYFLPKRAILVANVWAINRDPDVFGPDAHIFNPDRFLDPVTKALLPPVADTKKEGHVSFGFGRRICPGRYVANDILMINSALILWAMELRGPPTSDDKEALPGVDECVMDGVAVCVAQWCWQPIFTDKHIGIHSYSRVS